MSRQHTGMSRLHARMSDGLHYSLQTMHMKTDTQIKKDVERELEWDPKVSTHDISISVSNGVVTLRGEVDSYAKKIAAENAVKRTSGVSGLAEEVTVHIPRAWERTDTEIAEAAVASLRWAASVPDDKIQVVVDNGWVTLEGDVQWKFQKEEAEKAIRKNAGIKGVSNNIHIVPDVETPVVKSAIKKALERNADIEAESIEVAVDGSMVTLTGVVRTLNEKNNAERAAWSAPGVEQVINKLTVLYRVFV